MSHRWPMQRINRYDRNAIRSASAWYWNRLLSMDDDDALSATSMFRYFEAPIHPHTNWFDFCVLARAYVVWWHSTACNWAAMWTTNRWHCSRMRNDLMHHSNSGILVRIRICFESMSSTVHDWHRYDVPDSVGSRSFSKWRCWVDTMWRSTIANCRLFSICCRVDDAEPMMWTAWKQFRWPFRWPIDFYCSFCGVCRANCCHRRWRKRWSRNLRLSRRCCGPPQWHPRLVLRLMWPELSLTKSMNHNHFWFGACYRRHLELRDDWNCDPSCVCAVCSYWIHPLVCPTFDRNNRWKCVPNIRRNVNAWRSVYVSCRCVTLMFGVDSNSRWWCHPNWL